MTTTAVTTSDDELSGLGYAPQLRRQLGFGALLVYGLLFFVPMAPVATFGVIVNMSGGVPVLVFLLAAAVMGLSASSYREMALRFPVSGSVYSYVRLATGPRLGFVAGWMILLDYLMMPSLLVILASIALSHVVPGVPVAVFAAAFVLGSLLLNAFGVTVTTRAGLVLLAIQLVVIVAVLGFVGAAAADGSLRWSAAPLWRAGTNLHLVFAAVPIAAFSYLGFDAVATLNEEARGGGRAVAWATTLLLGAITVLFALQVWAAGLANPSPTFPAGAHTTRAFYDAVDAVAPHWFSVVFTLTNAFVAIFACLVVAHSSTARLLFAMGRDGTLPGFLGRTTPSGVPRNAVLLTAVLALLLAVGLAARPELATSMVTFGALSSYILLHLAVVIRCWGRERSGARLRHLVVPVTGALALAVALSQTETLTQLIGAGWLVAGVLGYGVASVLRRRRHSVQP